MDYNYIKYNKKNEGFYGVEEKNYLNYTFFDGGIFWGK